MNKHEDLLNVISSAIGRLRDVKSGFTTTLPSIYELKSLMRAVWQAVFFESIADSATENAHLTRLLTEIYLMLTSQLEIVLKICGGCLESEEAAVKFIDSLPEVRSLLLTDVEAIQLKDPAAVSAQEIIASYPAIKALLFYRVAHLMHRIGIPIIPRMITELAHSLTGIDIHPAATIGHHFAIDHGTGIVIGETTVIGNHVTIYQGVTLGAKGFVYDEAGVPQRVARHPIVEDNVTIYSNSSILGRVTIGHDSIIGGNVWLTHSVPPFSKITQRTHS